MNWYTKRRRAQHDQDFETWIQGGVCPTLNAFDNTGDSRATVVIMFDNSYRDGLRLQKGNTVNTLSAKMGTGGNNVPFVAIPIQGTIIGRQDHNGPQGKGFGDETDPMYTLDSVSQHGVATDMQARRLTPVECERLMGWPDNHTLPRGNGKENPDTTRYKMCGNGVASPVAQWIGQHLMAIINDE